jgi:hypothetical protein
VDDFFSPAGPDRSVVSSSPATCAAVIRVRISRTTSAARSAALARQEWMNPVETPAPFWRGSGDAGGFERGVVVVPSGAGLVASWPS